MSSTGAQYFVHEVGGIIFYLEEEHYAFIRG